MTSRNALPEFLNAVRDADLSAIRALATSDLTLLRASDPRCFGATALLRAVESDHRPTVDLLLDLGADINQRSDWWAGSFGVLDSASDPMAAHLLARGATLTPHAAARLGKLEELRAMLSADPALVQARGGDGQTPLHFARSTEIVDLLLERGAAIDALDVDHASTPAQWLCTSRPSIAAHLVARGAAPDPFLAVRANDPALLQRLLATEPGGVNTRVSRDRFPAPPPAAGHIYLYTIGEGCTLLHAAANAGQPTLIQWLADHGADPNARGGYDDATPLHAVAWADRTESISPLLQIGADINAVSGPLHRNEPIGWAIVSGALESVRTLMHHGASIKPHHRIDAKKGAQGAFRQFNPRRPIQAWADIDNLLANAK